MILNQDVQVRTPVRVSQSIRFRVLLIYAIALLVFGFVMDSWDNIIQGMGMIIIAPSVLITDYIAIAGVGATFVNCGLVTLISLCLVKLSKVKISGPIIAAIFTIAGFALFGKNVVNIWPIFFGVWLYSKYQDQDFGNFILSALFGTCLGPLVSQVAFGFGFTLPVGILLGITCGTIAGFILPPLAAHLVRTHAGYNIYNLGFTAGVVGTMFMSVFRGFGINGQPTFFWAEGYNSLFTPLLVIYFLSMIVVGAVLGKIGREKNATTFNCIMKSTGTLITDFVDVVGFGPAMVNMGVLGIISTLYIILVGGDLNGPTIGVILTVVAFGAFGKQPKNVIPIFIGVYLASVVTVWSPNAPGALLGAMCGTTLAPIAGAFGPIAGIIAGFLHLSIMMNVGFLHGGMNLYNNGFAGGLLAAALVPIIRALKRDNE